MKSVSNDAKGFVEGVVNHLKKSGKGGSAAMSPRVQSLLLKMSKNAKREHQATIQSAVKLTAAEEQQIARVLSRIAGHDVGITSVVNPHLIGGLRITMADWVMDSSIKAELQQMAAMIS